MGKVVPELSSELVTFIESQPVFFVATAPLSASGHVNLSPKGLDTFAVLSPTRVAYLDLTGSGNETAAHVAENGRVTVMFCSFAGPPRILRLYGRGTVCLPGDSEWELLRSRFGELPGVRQIVAVDITRVQTSCGFGVPLMDYRGPRDTLIRWAESKGQEGLSAYRDSMNAVSIDGLPAPTITAG
jgi:hypothetical protein